MARFSAIPDAPVTVGAQWESQMLEAIKQNVELLAGLRREADRASQAILKGDIRLTEVPPPSFSQAAKITAVGAGFTISGVQVASLDDHVKVIEDVANVINNIELLANDLNLLRRVVEVMLAQLRS